jgi:vacuolar protein sorting-associated protein IST1
VQSLIYAAARFSEFPELRDLRSAFIGRYGPSLEAFVNKEVITDSSSALFSLSLGSYWFFVLMWLITDVQFVEMLKPKSTTKEIKLQLMHDIAHDFSIEWNAKSLEQKLFKPPPSQQVSFPDYPNYYLPMLKGKSIGFWKWSVKICWLLIKIVTCVSDQISFKE